MGKRKLTQSQLDSCQELAEELFSLEQSCETHMAILREDPNAYATALEEYAATAPPQAAVVALEDVEQCLIDSERILKEECHTLIDHYRWVNTAMKVVGLKKGKARAEWNESVVNEMMRRLMALHDANPPTPGHFSIPQNPNAALLAMLAPPPPPPQRLPSPPHKADDDWPAEMPNAGKPFSEEDVEDLPRTDVTPSHIASWKKNSDSIDDYVFFAVEDNSGSDDEEIFRVALTLNYGRRKKIFYLVYVDQGGDAFGIDEESFFEMIEKGQFVKVGDEEPDE